MSLLHPKVKITQDIVRSLERISADYNINIIVDPDEVVPKSVYPCIVVDTDNEEIINKVDRGKSLYQRRWPINFESRFIKDYISGESSVSSLNRLKMKAYEIDLEIEKLMSFPSKVSPCAVNIDLIRSAAVLFTEGEMTYRAHFLSYEIEFQTSAKSIGAYDQPENKLGKIKVEIDGNKEKGSR